jgi:hypothetical protein
LFGKQKDDEVEEDNGLDLRSQSTLKDVLVDHHESEEPAHPNLIKSETFKEAQGCGKRFWEFD